MRISKEDGNRGESESIENQRKLLFAYCSKNGYQIKREYTDDGYSGTLAENRPALTRLKEDICNGKIKLLLTKDLSRLGRNIGDTTNLIDRFFPEHGVRFISVTEGIDTFSKAPGFHFITPVHNFTNELYSADISNKIRSALKVKMQNGEFIGSFAPYGYKKDASDKNRLIPDENTAGTVRRIFSLASEGVSPSGIAAILNREKIPTPSRYRYMKNPSLSGFRICDEWTGNGIGKLLRNEVYLGHTLQGKTEKPGFKSLKSRTLPKTEWIRAENTHSPLTDEKTAERIKEFMNSRRGRKSGNFKNIFSGTVFCADCGRAMSLSGKTSEGYKLNCGGYKLKGNRLCSSHPIEYARLYSIISELLDGFFRISQEKYIALCNEVLNECGNYEQEKKRLEEIKNKLLRLYDGKYSGEISGDYFNTLFEKYKEEEKVLQKKINKAPPEIPPSGKIFPSEPDERSIAKFIRRIEIGKDGSIDIYLTCRV